MNQINRYQILGELGGGGMALVYHAYDPRFKREVAIKVIAARFLHQAQFRQRFEREAQVIASLQHPAIVPVYDFGEENGQPFLVMALMQGGSLTSRLRNGPLSLQECIRLLEQLAPALDLAHRKGVVHRDLKPDNILFDNENYPYIADFGIAKLLAQTTMGLSHTGMVIGTPYYMSPEQARGEKHIDGRSDIYSLGAILFELLTGQRPYDADTPAGFIYKHIHEPVPNIRAIKPDLPPGCEALIRLAMAKDPNDRYTTVGEMAAAWQAVAQGTPISSHDSQSYAPTVVEAEWSKHTPPLIIVPTRPWWQKWLLLAGAATLLLIVIGVVMLIIGPSTAATSTNIALPSTSSPTPAAQNTPPANNTPRADPTSTPIAINIGDYVRVREVEGYASLNLRDAPTLSSTITKGLEAGSLLEVIESGPDFWWRVRSPFTAQEGWVRSLFDGQNFVERVEPVAITIPPAIQIGTYVRTAEADGYSALNLRQSPNTESSVIELLAFGTVAEVISGPQGLWWEVRLPDGQQGWVATFSFEGELNLEPAPGAENLESDDTSEAAPTATSLPSNTSEAAPTATPLPPTADPTSTPVAINIGDYVRVREVEGYASLNLRDAPTLSSTITKELEAGTLLEVIESGPDFWWRVRSPFTGQQGWIRSLFDGQNFVERVEPIAITIPPAIQIGTYVRTAEADGYSALNLRQSPNTESSVIELLAFGTVAEVISGPQGLWWEVRLPDGQEGWVATFSFEGELNLEPAPGAENLEPDDTSEAAPTATSRPSKTPEAAPTATSRPSKTPEAAPTATSRPSNTPQTAPTATPLPPTASPTSTPVAINIGDYVQVREVEGYTGLNLRDAPTLSSTITKELEPGTLLEVIESGPDLWWRVRSPFTGQQGWITSLFDGQNFVERVEPIAISIPPAIQIGTYVRIAEVSGYTGLNLRQSPNTDSSIIELLAFGTLAEVISGPQGLWWEVRLPDGQEGWVATFSFEGELNLEPAPGPENLESSDTSHAAPMINRGGYVRVLQVEGYTGLNLRDAPTLSSTITKELEPGTLLEVIESGPDLWWRVRSPFTGQQGWITSLFDGQNFVEPVAITIPPAIQIGTYVRIAEVDGYTGLNLRQSPNTDSSIIELVAFGTVAEVISGPQGLWWEVRLPYGQEGWVATFSFEGELNLEPAP